MDRLGRNMLDLLQTIRSLNDRAVVVEFVKERLMFSGEDSPLSKLQLGILAAVAEFERALIRERQREGIAIAKAKGVYTGRKKALSPEQLCTLRERDKLTGVKAARHWRGSSLFHAKRCTSTSERRDRRT